jgi:ethanolamine transporter
MVVFSVLGALDRIIGNKFGLGKEFEKGVMFLGVMGISMIGMIIIAPFIADRLNPAFNWIYSTLHLDPSIIPASLFANDMGGAPLAEEIKKNTEIGTFNAYIVSSMMGCTISFTIPYALGSTEQGQHKDMLLGFLCGIVTIPIGCFISGIVMGINIIALIINLFPLIIFSGIIACGLMLCPKVCIKIFGIFGTLIKIVITIGLSLGIIRFLTGYEVIKGLGTLEEGAAVCLNASAVMTGAFPFMYLVSKILSRPLKAIGKKARINETSTLGLVSSLATSATTFEMMKNMDRKGVVLNSAFAISAAFTFAGHLAYTMAGNSECIVPMIIGKLISGITALILAVIIYKRNEKTISN